MATINKNFKIKNGLVVEGTTATVNGNQILTETASDQYILDLIGGETLVKSVSGNLSVDGAGNLTINESDLITGIAGAYLYNDNSGHIAVDIEGILDDVATSTLTFTNKTLTGTTYLQSPDGSTATSNYIDVDNTGKLSVISGYALDASAWNDITLSSGGGNINLNTTMGNVKVNGYNVASTDYVDALGTRDNTYDTVVRRDGFGNFAASQIDLSDKLTAQDVRLGNAGQIRDLDGDLEVSAYDANTLILRADADVNITGDSFVTLNASGGAVTVNATGNIDLYPGTGNAAYVDEDEIVTRTATQEISNKTIVDELYFRNTATSSQDGVVVVNNATENFEITANTADLNLTSSNGHVRIESNTGDVNIYADSAAYYGSSSPENEIATHGYVDNAISGLDWKQAVHLLWNDPNATLTGTTGTLGIDGHAFLNTSNNGYRILITAGTNRGIWEYSDDNANWTLTRTTDADVYSELIGSAVYVMEGDQFGSTSWVQSNHYLGDFTGQSWTQFSGQGSVTGGTGIIVDGLEVSVDTDVIATQTDLSTGLGTKQDTLTAGDGLDITGSTLSVNTGSGITTSGDEVVVDRTTVDTWYDASGAAGTAESNANSYTNTALESYTPTSSLETTIDGYGFAYSSEIPGSTDALGEGVNNLYFTDQRAKEVAATLLSSSSQTNISITQDPSGNLTIVAENGVEDSTTDDLDEGSTNLYFTDQRAVDAVSGSNITPATVTIDTYRREEATQTYIANTSTTTIHSFDYPYESAKYLVRVVGSVSGTKHSQLTEILVTTDGNNNIAITEYGNIHTSDSPLATFTAAWTGTYDLTVTPAVSGCEVILAATMLSWAD